MSVRSILVAVLAAGAHCWSPMTPPSAGGVGAFAAADSGRLLLPNGGQPQQLLRAGQPSMMPIGVPKVAYRVPGGECAPHEAAPLFFLA